SLRRPRPYQSPLIPSTTLFRSKGEPRLIALQPSIACSLPRRGDTDLERRIFARIASQAERRRYDHRNLARTGSAIRVSQPYDVLRLRCTETQSPGDAGAHGRPP